MGKEVNSPLTISFKATCLCFKRPASSLKLASSRSPVLPEVAGFDVQVRPGGSTGRCSPGEPQEGSVLPTQVPAGTLSSCSSRGQGEAGALPIRGHPAGRHEKQALRDCSTQSSTRKRRASVCLYNSGSFGPVALSE